MTYENLKVLCIKDLYFKLPEDFIGGLSDALRLMADYHDEVKNTEKHEMEPSFMSDKDRAKSDDNWYRFLDILEKGQKFTGIISISEYEDTNDNSGGIMKQMKDWDTK